MPDDFAFTYAAQKTGDVHIHYRGKLAANDVQANDAQMIFRARRPAISPSSIDSSSRSTSSVSCPQTGGARR